MTKENELTNMYTNNSSVLIAPSRSEIRVSVTIPNFQVANLLKKVLLILFSEKMASALSVLSGVILFIHWSLNMMLPMWLLISSIVLCATFSNVFFYHAIIGEKGIKEFIQSIREEE